jgi:hypothetical protein
MKLGGSIKRRTTAASYTKWEVLEEWGWPFTFEANAFFFALDDVGSGVHNVIVQARIDTATSAQEGVAEALALVGKGAVVVEEIHLLGGQDILLN